MIKKKNKRKIRFLLVLLLSRKPRIASIPLVKFGDVINFNLLPILKILREKKRESESEENEGTREEIQHDHAAALTAIFPERQALAQTHAHPRGKLLNRKFFPKSY